MACIFAVGTVVGTEVAFEIGVAAFAVDFVVEAAFAFAFAPAVVVVVEDTEAAFESVGTVAWDVVYIAVKIDDADNLDTGVEVEVGIVVASLAGIVGTGFVVVGELSLQCSSSHQREENPSE